ncbi:hypothetical protein [Almyronema epifaneia]|uniref:Uncharacterized protein n=1 Tax=Almyronema epifaneia S1 TaxID=2991925 RepID=A0ABW6IC20_9CYAN
MASQQQVREYLAYWFQLGKPLIIGAQPACLPKPVFQGDRYSEAFETCWQQVMVHKGQDAYIEGTDQSMAELLSDTWDLPPCARCSMPVPMRTVGVSDHPCPCHDLASWPNSEIPAPRSAVDTPSHLQGIRHRLAQSRLESGYANSPDYPQVRRTYEETTEGWGLDAIASNRGISNVKKS